MHIRASWPCWTPIDAQQSTGSVADSVCCLGIGGQDLGGAIDLPTLCEVCALDPQGDLLPRLLTAYLSMLDRVVPECQKSLSLTQFDEVMRLAHSLKSSSATLGALRLARACRDLESAIRNRAPHDVIVAGVHLIEQEAQCAGQALKACLRFSPLATPAPADRSPQAPVDAGSLPVVDDDALHR